jgi:hypothetical protein
VVHFCLPDDWPSTGKKEFEWLQNKVKKIRSDRDKLTRTIAKKDKQILAKKTLNLAKLESYPLVDGKEQTVVKQLRAISKKPEKSVVLGMIKAETDEWFLKGEALRATAWKEEQTESD